MTSGTGRGSGFTLVEVLVAIAILSVGSVLILQALGRVASVGALIEQRRQAYFLLVSKIAEAELSLRRGEDLEAASGTHRRGEWQFEWSQDSKPASEEGEAEAEETPWRRISVAVAWTSGRDRREGKIETLLKLITPSDET